VTTVSSIMPPFSFVKTDRDPDPFSMLLMSPTTSFSRKVTASLPCPPALSIIELATCRTEAPHEQIRASVDVVGYLNCRLRVLEGFVCEGI
jgi:hypothetical protein